MCGFGPKVGLTLVNETIQKVWMEQHGGTPPLRGAPIGATEEVGVDAAPQHKQAGILTS